MELDDSTGMLKRMAPLEGKHEQQQQQQQQGVEASAAAGGVSSPSSPSLHPSLDSSPQASPMPQGLDGGAAVFGGGGLGLEGEEGEDEEDDYEDDFDDSGAEFGGGDDDAESAGFEISEEVLSVGGGSQSFDESSDFMASPSGAGARSSSRPGSALSRPGSANRSGNRSGGGGEQSVSLSVSVLDSVDQSVDSHALDDYDFVESVQRN